MEIEIVVYFSEVFHRVCDHLPSKLTLDPSHGTLRMLIHSVAERCGEKGRTLLYDPAGNSIQSALMVMVNEGCYTGNAINAQDIPLRDKDKVSFLYFVSGG